MNRSRIAGRALCLVLRLRRGRRKSREGSMREILSQYKCLTVSFKRRVGGAPDLSICFARGADREVELQAFSSFQTFCQSHTGGEQADIKVPGIGAPEGPYLLLYTLPPCRYLPRRYLWARSLITALQDRLPRTNPEAAHRKI